MDGPAGQPQPEASAGRKPRKAKQFTPPERNESSRPYNRSQKKKEETQAASSSLKQQKQSKIIIEIAEKMSAPTDEHWKKILKLVESFYNRADAGTFTAFLIRFRFRRFGCTQFAGVSRFFVLLYIGFSVVVCLSATFDVGGCRPRCVYHSIDRSLTRTFTRALSPPFLFAFLSFLAPTEPFREPVDWEGLGTYRFRAFVYSNFCAVAAAASAF